MSKIARFVVCVAVVAASAILPAFAGSAEPVGTDFVVTTDAGETYTYSTAVGNYAHLSSPGACIEDLGLHLVKFEAEHLTKSNAIGVEDARQLELIADGKPPDLPENSVNQFMEVLSDFEDEEWFSKDAGWNKKLADAVKAELRGKECVMQDFNAPHKLGEAVPDLIGENGLPVVKALTDELIDELGPKILREYFRD